MRTHTVRNLLISFIFILSSCTFNANVSNLDSLLSGGGSENLTPGPSPIEMQKIFVDITNVTMTEGSVAIINVAVNPVSDVDTVVNLDLSSNASSFVRFNPIPTQITIPAGSTSKSIVINTVDDSLMQDQEGWKFTITSADGSIQADPGTLNITLNDNDGGAIPDAPAAAPSAKLLKEFNSYPATINKIVFNGKVYYSGSDAANGTELWVSDGTPTGTKLLKDIEPGLGSSVPTNFYVAASTPYLFFVATTSTEGLELWRTDGTEAGTILVKDLEPGAANTTITIRFNHNGIVYFLATTTTDGTELYVTDGTYSGTKLLTNVPGTGYFTGATFLLYNSELFFAGKESIFGTYKIYKTDGTVAGTSAVVTQTSTNADCYYGITLDRVFNGKMLFQGDCDAGDELYATEGTNATTILLKDIKNSSLSSYAYSTAFNINGKQIVLYSSDDTGTNGFYLTDGTPAGTVKAAQTASISYTLGVIGNNFLYTACSPDCELYSSGGVSYDAVRIKDIYTGLDSVGNPNSSTPYIAAQIGNKIFFTATSAAEGKELWVTDGTAGGTFLLKDIYAGTQPSTPTNFLVIGSELLFTARSDSFGDELWITDGTVSGTSLYKDLYPGAKGSGPSNLLAVDGSHIFFTAYNTASKFASVFTSDLSLHNAVGFGHAMLETLNSETKTMNELNGLVYFDAMEQNSGNPLWVTDGTSANTVKIKDLYPNIICSDLTSLMSLNGSLFFLSSTEATGSELHITDGTTAGTQVLKEIGPGALSGGLTAFTKTDFGKIFFAASGNTAVGDELYVTDGTALGTQLVKDITVGSGSFSPRKIVALPGLGKVIFNQITPPYATYLTDGTNAGTAPVTGLTTIYSVNNYFPTPTGAFFIYTESGTYRMRINHIDATTNAATLLNTSYTTDIVINTPAINPISNILYYATSNSSSTVLNFWKSDGTVAGTTLLTNIPIVGNNFGISFLGNLGSKTFFQYFNNTSSPYVRQLWVTDGTIAGTIKVDDANNTTSANYTIGVEFNGQFYFSKYESSTGNELWKTDGTIANTKMVKDIYPGTGSSTPAAYVPYNGKLYFTATDDVNGLELWRTDGTLLGTELVSDINPGRNSSNPAKINVFAGKLYFTAIKVLSGREVWVYSE